MSSDHFQRQIDVIVENQAKFSEDMHKLKDVLLSLTHIVERHDNQIAALIEQNKELVEHNKRIDIRFEETGERLNALINLFERHITEDHKQL